MIRQQLLPARGRENVIRQTFGIEEVVGDSLSSKKGIVEMVEKFLLGLTDWQQHLSSPLLSKNFKERKRI